MNIEKEKKKQWTLTLNFIVLVNNLCFYEVAEETSTVGHVCVRRERLKKEERKKHLKGAGNMHDKEIHKRFFSRFCYSMR